MPRSAHRAQIRPEDRLSEVAVILARVRIASGPGCFMGTRTVPATFARFGLAAEELGLHGHQARPTARVQTAATRPTRLLLRFIDTWFKNGPKSGNTAAAQNTKLPPFFEGGLGPAAGGRGGLSQNAGSRALRYENTQPSTPKTVVHAARSAHEGSRRPYSANTRTTSPILGRGD